MKQNEKKTFSNSSESSPDANALQKVLQDEPLTLDMMTSERASELLGYYIDGVRAGTLGDDILRSMVHERNFEKICATTLMRILTTRINAHPENTARRKEMRNHLQPLLKKIFRKRKDRSND